MTLENSTFELKYQNIQPVCIMYRINYHIITTSNYQSECININTCGALRVLWSLTQSNTNDYEQWWCVDIIAEQDSLSKVTPTTMHQLYSQLAYFNNQAMEVYLFLCSFYPTIDGAQGIFLHASHCTWNHQFEINSLDNTQMFWHLLQNKLKLCSWLS